MVYSEVTETRPEDGRAQKDELGQGSQGGEFRYLVVSTVATLADVRVNSANGSSGEGMCYLVVAISFYCLCPMHILGVEMSKYRPATDCPRS